MIDEMTVAMATDLNIHQFANENSPRFINRLLYSAMACWIKTAALDSLVSFSTERNQGTSRKHILDRCEGILIEMLRRFPMSNIWFKTEHGDTAVQLLRSRLIRHGDLLNIGFQSNLTLAPATVLPISSDLECGKGFLLDSSFSYSGIAMLRKRITESPYEENSRVDSLEWMREYIKSSKGNWTTDKNFEDAEYFNPFCTEKSNNYRCGQRVLPTSVEGIILARRTERLISPEYLLIKPDKDMNMKFHCIDPFLRDTGEYRRFQFALREAVGNNLAVDAKIYRDYVNLRFGFYLPEWENRLLESFAWPCNSITDKLEWNMLPVVWPYIRINLEKLGITVREEIIDG